MKLLTDTLTHQIVALRHILAEIRINSCTSGSIIGSHMEEQHEVIVNSIGETLVVSLQHRRFKPSARSKLLQMTGQTGRWVPLFHATGSHPLCYRSPLLPGAFMWLKVSQPRFYTWKYSQLLLSFEGREPVL